MKKVLFLGAHPDDEMGCAGTLARLAGEGADVEVLTFSGCHDLIPEGFTADDLASEWAAACVTLGLKRPRLQLWDVPNRNFPQHRQAILDALDDHRQCRHDLILVPSTWDTHQDHATVAAEAMRAFKNSTILGYELPLNTITESRLSAYVPLTDSQMSMKLAHAALYRSQASKPYMAADYILGLARTRGIQCGTRHAEAFEVIRWVW